MCGIAGFVLNKPADQKILRRMGEQLLHRGPDSSGSWLKEGVGLSHRRLSILDLSDHASQPMVSRNGRYVAVFNGEIYNYREIADRFGIKDLRSTGDTEVLLEAFCKAGPKVVEAFNGMFAMAIWDIESSTLHIFRDRLGIKPFFYSITEDGDFYFASEIKSLLAVPEIAQSRQVNSSAVSAFLHLGYIPSPLSIYRNICQFPKGHAGTFSEGTLDFEPFWSLAESKPASTTKDYLEGLIELIHSSVKYRLISDVPTGTFLSGGIDSSLVTAVAAKESSGTLKTFSIGFAESKFDESTYARSVAKYLETEHTEFMLTYEEARSRFEDILDTYDEPFGDVSSIPTMMVSELAHQDVTVALSGDGGDETHLGYGSYVWADRLSRPGVRQLSPFISTGLSFLNDRFKRVSKLFQMPDSEYMPSHIFSQEQYAFSLAELEEMLLEKGKGEFELRQTFAHVSSQVQRQSLFDLEHYLPDDLLVKVDRASMRVGLEVRVPLLDHRLVEFAARLPVSTRTNRGAKALLKQVLYRYVPQELFQRPKWGFGMPVGDWLRGEWSVLIHNYLSKEVVDSAGFVRWDYLERLKNRYFTGSDHLYHRLWLLILLHKWYLEKFRSL